MRKTDLTPLERAVEKAKSKYSEAKRKIEFPSENSDLSFLARDAQLAWDDFKKLEADLHDNRILKKLGDLYGL